MCYTCIVKRGYLISGICTAGTDFHLMDSLYLRNSLNNEGVLCCQNIVNNVELKEKGEKLMELIETIKNVVTLAQKTDNIELVKQILELQQEMMEMQDENIKLKKELDKINEVASKNIEYNEDRTAVYEIVSGGSKEGPYCTKCWEVNRQLVSLHPDETTGGFYSVCPNCQDRILKEKKRIKVQY